MGSDHASLLLSFSAAGRLCQHILNQQGIDIDRADLQQVQRHRQFLIRRPVAGKFSVFAIKIKLLALFQFSTTLRPALISQRSDSSCK